MINLYLSKLYRNIFVLYYKNKLLASMQRATSSITLKRIKLLWVLSLTRKEELVIKTIHSVHQQKSCNNDKGTVFSSTFLPPKLMPIL